MSKKEILQNEPETEDHSVPVENVNESEEIEEGTEKDGEEEDDSGKKARKRRKSTSGSKKMKKLEADLEEVKSDLEELRVKYVRQAADFDNFRKRTAKERVELIKTAAQDTLTTLLPVLDDFDRAAKIADDDGTSETMSDGVRLVYHRLKTTLEQIGLKEMETNGEVFDADLHEAITEIPAPSDDMKGKIVDTIEKGYYLNDKIIRYARVVVGK